MDFSGTRYFKYVLTVLAFALLSLRGYASEGAKEEKFDPGHLILHHVVDAHDWHFATIGDHHYTIYLPVIVYGPNGLEVFSSSNLHHHAATEGGHDEANAHTTDAEGETDAVDNGHTMPAHAVVYNGYYLNGDDKLRRTDEASFYDLSITKNVASLFLSVILLFVVFTSVAGAYKKRGIAKPTGLQSMLEPIIVFVRDEIAKPNIGPKYEKFLPYLLTVFFFIWFNNLLGLLPGGANFTGNIAVTMTLALLTFIITTINGNKDYWKHVYNTPGVPWWLKFPVPLMPAVEFIGLFTKPISLMIRLFANITAGHIIILSLFSLIFIFESFAVGFVSSAFVVAMTFMELLVALIQAYVFTLLTSMYFGGAVAEHEHDHAHDHDHAQEFEHETGQVELAKADTGL